MIWVEIRHLAVLEGAAAQRNAQKRDFESSRYWNANSHLEGLKGEYVFAVTCGLKMNLALLINGDGGFDFPDTDVKTSTFAPDPHLKHPANRPMRSMYVALVLLDGERGAYLGFAPAFELLSAPVQTYRDDAGPQHFIPAKELYSGLPPPCRKKDKCKHLNVVDTSPQRCGICGKELP